LFKKIERPTHIYQDVANQIEDAILSEKLKIGDRLPAERELAETFEISRRTLRESLRVVEQKGLIEIKSTGAFVRMATSEKLSQSLGLAIRSKQIAWKDITLFRTEMEGNIVMKVAKRATRKDIEALAKIVKDAEALLAGEELNWIAYLSLDKKMHLTLAQIAGNPIYALILKTFLDNLMPYFEAFRLNEKDFSQANLRTLSTIVEEIKKGNARGAKKAISEHFKLGNAYMRKAGIY
jgi:DNA-binding FadR family transcriptional regulator